MNKGSRAKLAIWLEALPFAFFYVLDRGSKAWASKSTDLEELGCGILTFKLNLNHGLMLGWLGHIPPYVKYVTITSLCALIFCGYFFYRFFVPISSMKLRLGGALLLSGIVGNVADRLTASGGVVDFIVIRFPSYQSPIFNVADVVQILGYVLILLGMWSEANHWRQNDTRALSWISPRFQLRFCLFFLAGSLSTAFVISLLNYTFVRSLLSMGNLPPQEQNDILWALLVALVCVMGALFLIIIAAGYFYSKKIAGPLFSIRRYLDRTNQGERAIFKLREGDDLKEFEKPLNELNEKLNHNR